MGLLDGIIAELQNSPLAGFLQQKAAAADQGGVDESGFAQAYPPGPVPLPPQRPAMAGAPQPLPPPITIGSTPTDKGGVPFALAPPPMAPQPSQAALPPNAAPTQGQAPAALVPPAARNAMAQAGPASDASLPGVGDRLGAAFQGFANAGSPMQALGNLVGGLATGQRTDPAGVMLQSQKSTFKALVDAGVPTSVAQAAALNPEVMKTIAPQLYSKPEFKTIKNALGEDIPIFADAGKGTVTYPTANGGTGAGGPDIGGMQKTFDQIEQGRTAGVPQDQLLQAIPNSLREGVRAMLTGGVIPSNLSNRGAARDLTLRFAHAVDPTFDESLIPARVALQKDYQGGGKAFEEVNALNTVAGHMLRLKNSADGLDNTGFKPWNWLKNNAADYTVGSPALVKFRNDLVTTQNELAKAYHGGHVSDSAYAAFNKAIGEAQTPAELKAAIGELSGLLGSKIEAREKAYQVGMNGLPQPKQYRALNDEAKHSFGEINKWVGGGAPAAAPNAASPQLPHVASVADAAKLPKGSQFVDPQGNVRTVP